MDKRTSKKTLKITLNQEKERMEPQSTQPIFSFRHLRERMNLSQAELARRIKFSRKKLHSIESKPHEQIKLGEIHLLAKALGYRLSDLLHLVHVCFHKDFEIQKIILETPGQILHLGEGIKLYVFRHEKLGHFIGMLVLDAGKSVKRDFLPFHDLVFGFVLEGVLFMDCLGIRQQVIRAKQAFYFNQAVPIEFCNNESFQKLSILLFSVFTSAV